MVFQAGRSVAVLFTQKLLGAKVEILTHQF